MLTEEGRVLRNQKSREYNRDWRRRNPEKVRAQMARSWLNMIKPRNRQKYEVIAKEKTMTREETKIFERLEQLKRDLWMSQNFLDTALRTYREAAEAVSVAERRLIGASQRVREFFLEVDEMDPAVFSKNG